MGYTEEESDWREWEGAANLSDETNRKARRDPVGGCTEIIFLNLTELPLKLHYK